MSGRTIWTLLVGVILAIVLVGVGVQVYEMGLAQGIAQGAPAVSGQPGVAPPAAPYPYYGYGHWFRPWGFGFGFLHLLFPLLIFFLIFGLFRALWWGGRGWGGRGWGDRVPPGFDDWHRRAHEGQTGSGQEARTG